MSVTYDWRVVRPLAAYNYVCDPSFEADPTLSPWVLRTSASDECYDEIAAGCPVCGGKLFLAHVYELGINEIGRFYGKLRTAERPARAAFDLNGPDDRKRPMRHFVELMLSGRYGFLGIGLMLEPKLRQTRAAQSLQSDGASL